MAKLTNQQIDVLTSDIVSKISNKRFEKTLENTEVQYIIIQLKEMNERMIEMRKHYETLYKELSELDEKLNSGIETLSIHSCSGYNWKEPRPEFDHTLSSKIRNQIILNSIFSNMEELESFKESILKDFLK